MVLRMKPNMDKLISPHQSAFIGGMLIRDNIIIVQEMFYTLNSRRRIGEENISIKLDMHKVYDRLDWSFLEKVLLAFGFPHSWVSLIMVLVKGVSYKTKINGFEGKSFKPHRGLRQGDMLSPYLFILAS